MMVTPFEIRSGGILIRPGKVLDITEYGCRTKLLISPGTSSALTLGQVVYHNPGVHSRFIHTCPRTELFKGKGEAFLEDSWYEVKEGDVLYAPCHIRHGTRNNNESGEPFICTGAAALPQMDLCRLAGYL